jgi:site-specific recombinase XerD
MANEQPAPARSVYELVGSQVRIFCRDGIWHANFQHEGRQHRQSLGTRNKKEARRRASRIDARLLEGQFARPARVPTLDSVVEKYRAFLENEGRSLKTLQKYRAIFDRVLELAAARRVTKISAVNLEFIDAYTSQRVADEVAKKTIHTELVVIRQIVNFALSRQMVSFDPLAQLKLKKPKLRPQPCWTRDQCERILAASREPYRSMLIVLSETGMRVGELKHLTWADVDAEHRVIQVREKEGWRPKTGDQRSIPMSPQVQTLFAQLPRRGRWVFTAPPSPAYPQGDHQLSERRLLEHLKQVLKRLGLAGHVHTFRHTFISLALCAGVPEAVVRSWVGHVDPQVIRQYTHVHDETSLAAMERLAAAHQTL